MNRGESNIFCINRGEAGISTEERGETAGRIVDFYRLTRKVSDYKIYAPITHLQ